MSWLDSIETWATALVSAMSVGAGAFMREGWRQYADRRKEAKAELERAKLQASIDDTRSDMRVLREQFEVDFLRRALTDAHDDMTRMAIQIAEKDRCLAALRSENIQLRATIRSGGTYNVEPAEEQLPTTVRPRG